MKRLLVICPKPEDGTSFYRGVGPLSSLSRKHDFDILQTEKIDWMVLKSVDAVFLQRPFLKDHADLLVMAKDAHKPVWVDYDDLLTHIPDSNPGKDIYWRPDVQKAIQLCIQNADVVTVSTDAIGEAWKQLRPQGCLTIPNAWDDELFPRPEPLKRANRILWRGSYTHDEDLHSVETQLEAVAQARSDVDWYFVGTPFWQTLRRVGKHREVTLIPWDGIQAYFRSLHEAQALVQIVPLVDNPLNRCKSNIAWIEASWAGSAVLAPNWTEWMKLGVTTYGAPVQFRERLEALLADLGTEGKARESWQLIESELRLSRVNQRRWSLLRDLGF